MPGGRPSKFTEAVEERLIDGLMEFKSISQICKAPNMPSAKTIARWFHQYPEFRERYLKVCELREQMFVDDLLSDGPGAFTTPRARHAADRAISVFRRMQPKGLRSGLTIYWT
ncbi:hypothetical protein [Pelagibius sp. Alg239-R121]|uniref:terminase small subunit-like protein n=1 Tax=Pelagibius sp. Alg239-R121 TaxID=2993448 RepID=UPI0024A726BC|nr:hypothetical protein [Pelagibius sp. Alg239-R121]